MAGFWGGTHFVSEMSSEILRIDSVTLTHRSASYEKRPHALTADFQGSTGVAVGYGPREIGFLCLVRYAIPSCAKLDRNCETLTVCRGKVGRPRGLGFIGRSDRCVSTDSF